MTRVLFDHQIFAIQEFGGISRYYFELARRIQRAAGYSATIVAPLHINAYLDRSQVGVIGARIPRPGGRFNIPAFVNHILAEPVYRFGAPDIIHETFYRERPSGPARCPRVLTVYDMIHERFPAQYKNGKTRISSGRQWRARNTSSASRKVRGAT